MDDKEPSRVWIVFGILLAAITLTFVMLVFTSVKAHAQEIPCAPAEAFLRQTIEFQKQRPVWEGTAPLPDMPPGEVVILQSEKGTWSLFLINQGRACLLAVGIDANPPITFDKGT